MTRTTISLPEELLRRLKRLAAERGISMAALIREAAEEKVETGRPKPRLAIFASEVRTTSRDQASEPSPGRSFEHIMGREPAPDVPPRPAASGRKRRA